MPNKNVPGKTPVIVYMDDADHAKLVKIAKEEERSVSAVARRLLRLVLKQR